MNTEITNHRTDAELHLVLQRRDEGSFETLYTQYSEMLYGLALQSLEDEVYVDEIICHTFLNAWKSAHTYDCEKVKLSTWLIRILISTTENYLSSKNLQYSFTLKKFPTFSFQILQEKAC